MQNQKNGYKAIVIDMCAGSMNIFLGFSMQP